MSELPPEAGDVDKRPFEPVDEWLAAAAPKLQRAAMRRWFLDRYEDPAYETPWSGDEKRYIFVWGGPYDPDEVLQERFDGIVNFDVIHELVKDLYAEVGPEWAPVEHEGVEYEAYLTHLVVESRHDPYSFLRMRVDQIDSVARMDGLTGQTRQLVFQMAHTSLIAALEAFLADTVSYWVYSNDDVLRRLVTTNRDFQGRTASLSDLFDRLAGIKEEVRLYLETLVWHRMDKIKPIVVSAFEIDVPEIGDLMKEVIVRHDIVHRAGRRVDGSLVAIDADDLERVRRLVLDFADAIESALAKRFPQDQSTAAVP